MQCSYGCINLVDMGGGRGHGGEGAYTRGTSAYDEVMAHKFVCTPLAK